MELCGDTINNTRIYFNRKGPENRIGALSIKFLQRHPTFPRNKIILL